jgi:hypothetical protein
MAVTHDAVTALVRPRLVEHGVLTVPNLLKGQVTNTGMTTKSGIPIIRYEALYRLAFVNCDEPQEVVTVDIESHALDEGDKAPGKALSYAVKYALLKLFNIETGEDDERRYEDAKVEKKKFKSVPKEFFDALSETDQIAMRDAAMEPLRMIHAGDIKGAYEQIESYGYDSDDMTAFWALFDSKERSSLKSYRESLKGTKDGLRAA